MEYHSSVAMVSKMGSNDGVMIDDTRVRLTSAPAIQGLEESLVCATIS